jgi:hypothetical protein
MPRRLVSRTSRLGDEAADIAEPDVGQAQILDPGRGNHGAAVGSGDRYTIDQRADVDPGAGRVVVGQDNGGRAGIDQKPDLRAVGRCLDLEVAARIAHHHDAAIALADGHAGGESPQYTVADAGQLKAVGVSGNQDQAERAPGGDSRENLAQGAAGRTRGWPA